MVGCMKCGSTTVWQETLRSPHVAAMFSNAQKYKEPGVLWFSKLKPGDAERYVSRLPTATADGIAAAGQGPKELPLMTVDASPSLLMYETPRNVRQVFPDDYQQLKFVAVLRHPVDRAISDFGRRKSEAEWPRDKFLSALSQEMTAELALLTTCRDRTLASRQRGGWWEPCSRQVRGKVSQPTVSRGLYGEQLRSWFCAMLAHDGVGGAAGDCVTFSGEGADTDPATGQSAGSAAGVLSAPSQNRLLVMSMEKELSVDQPAAIDRILEFVGLPPLSALPPPGPAVPGSAVHVRQQPQRQPQPPQSRPHTGNKGNHVRVSAEEVLDAVDGLRELFTSDAAHVRELTGIDFGWQELRG